MEVWEICHQFSFGLSRTSNEDISEVLSTYNNIIIATCRPSQVWIGPPEEVEVTTTLNPLQATYNLSKWYPLLVPVIAME